MQGTLIFTHADGSVRVLKPSNNPSHKVTVDIHGIKHDFNAILGTVIKFPKTIIRDSKESLKLAKKAFKTETINIYGSMKNYNKHINSTKVVIN